jgi:hypothetical protein
VSLESLSQEALGGRDIAPFAGPELDRITIAVDGTVQIPPLPADFDECLVNVPLPCDAPFARIELLQQERGIVNSPEVTVT